MLTLSKGNQTRNIPNTCVCPTRRLIVTSLLCRSDRVKSCDLHPTEQWMLVSLYNGNVHIWNYESQQLVKSFEVRESWIPNFHDLTFLCKINSRFAICRSERLYLCQGRTGLSPVLMTCRLNLGLFSITDLSNPWPLATRQACL